MGSAVILTGAAGAPTNATYLVQTANSGLSAEQAMGTLATGLVKNTTTTGVQSIAVDGTDYLGIEQGRHCHMREIFDGLATGAINGLGSYFQAGTWTDTSAATCTTTVAVKSGSDKMLRLFAPAGAGTAGCNVALSSTTGLSGGCRLRWKMRSDQDATGYSGGVLVANAASSTVASVRFGYSSGWKLRFYDGTTTTNITAAAKNTWYTIDMYVVASGTGGSAKIFIDGAYATALNCGGTGASWNSVRAYCTNSGAADLNIDVDDLQVYSLMPLFTEL